MRDVVIQLHPGEYHDFVRYLAAMEFEAIVLETPVRRFKTLRQLLGQYFWGACQLLKHLPKLRRAHTVIVFSHFALVVKLFARLGLVRYQRLFSFGFFLHNPRWFGWFRWLRRLDRENDHYIVFSESEVPLYCAKLGIDTERLHFVPLGDWRQTRACSQPVQLCQEQDTLATVGERPPLQSAHRICGDYYFAGGRSNRDYASLIEAFRAIPAKLLIVCSRSNLEELEDTVLPQNVTRMCDIPAPAFDELIRGARAGIIPLQHDTGSSGQSVALTLMRYAKCVIATRVAALREYIEDGISGFWLNDATADLPELIRRLEVESGLAETMGRAALRRYQEQFSLSIAMSAFENVLASVPIQICEQGGESAPAHRKADPSLRSE